MSAILPPPPRPASTVPGPSSPRAQVIAEPSIDASRLPVGSSVRGHVLAGAPKGAVHIQTDAGLLVGKSTLPLPEGSNVTLLLQARTSRLHLQITSVTGQSPNSPQPSAARAAPTEVVAVAPRSPETQAPASPAATRTPPALAPGATTNAPLSRPVTGPSAALPAGSQPAVRAVSAQGPAAGLPGAAVAPSGVPAPAPAQILGGTAMPSISGAPLGTPGPAATAALPQGGAVNVEIIGPTVVPSSAPGVMPTPSVPDLNPADTRWPALAAALETVEGIDPAAARHVMDTVVPRLNSGLTSQALFFLRALGRGNIHEWLGETSTEVLRSANPGLLSQLGEEFRRMGRTSAEAESNDWRVLHLPLSSGTEIEPVRLLMRRHGGGGEEAGKTDPDTRFVVEVTLSHLGRIQFDGLVREDGKRLDLIVRSDPPLPSTLHGNIRTLFTRSSEIAGLRGELGFQASPPEFVDVKAESPAALRSGMVV